MILLPEGLPPGLPEPLIGRGCAGWTADCSTKQYAQQCRQHLQLRPIEVAHETTFSADKRHADKAKPSIFELSLSDSVLHGLDRARPNDFPRWSGFEYRGFFGEGIDAVPCLGGRFLDDNKFRKAWNKEGARLLQLLVANSSKRFHDSLNVAFLEVRMRT